jgi:thiamine-phosphate pyrophosphorylase
VKRYFITDRKAAGGFRALLEIIRDQLHLGIDYLQIREKDLTARELFEFALAVLELRNEMKPARPTRLLINSRADVASACGADGVHLPASAPTVTLPGLLVFRSCHTLQEVRAAQADAVTFGPVFDSPGKGAPVGLDALKAACTLSKPVFALGGVTWENADACVAAGAAGIAGIRLFQEPDLI